jgi:hypothetical protein
MFPSIVKYNVLHPQRSQVISRLSKALDDPKRSVRKEAVDTRYVLERFINTPHIYLLFSQIPLVCVSRLNEISKGDHSADGAYSGFSFRCFDRSHDVAVIVKGLSELPYL